MLDPAARVAREVGERLHAPADAQAEPYRVLEVDLEEDGQGGRQEQPGAARE